MQGFKRFVPRNRQGIWLLASSIALGILVAPFAIAAGEGDPVLLGKRNPGGGGSAQITRETQIIAQTPINTYGTRQSNKGAGGGAIYGCRSKLGAAPADPKVTTPCVRVNNLDNGEAFQFSSLSGTTIGVIQAGKTFATPVPTAKPFITNATGVADGLNADKVDGKDADQIIAEARQTNPAGSAPSFAFARVGADGKTLDASRTQGVTTTNLSHPATGVYCFFGIASQTKSANVNIDTSPGEAAVNTTDAGPCAGTGTTNDFDLRVMTYDSAGAAKDLPFYVTMSGSGG